MESDSQEGKRSNYHGSGTEGAEDLSYSGITINPGTGQWEAVDTVLVVAF